MKRYLSQLVFFVMVVVMFLLVGCAPQEAAAQFVELPDDTKVRLTALVVAVAAFFFAKLIELVPWLAFLEQFRLPVSLVIAAELINVIQNAVPDAFAAVAVLAIQLLLELIALVLVFVKLRERGVKAFR